METPKRKRVGADKKMIICANQGWRCNKCRQKLPPTVEIDHYIPLGCGLWHLLDFDPNGLENLQALCPNCHASKTMRERMYAPVDSYIPCECGRTHSRYFLPTCKKWTKKLDRIKDGVCFKQRKLRDT